MDEGHMDITRRQKNMVSIDVTVLERNKIL